MMAGNSNFYVLAAQAAPQGKNQHENQGTACEAAKQQGPSFTVPKNMAFCAASEDEHVGTSKAGINFKKGIDGCYIMFIAAQITKDYIDYY
jgi:hypothetical protein